MTRARLVVFALVAGCTPEAGLPVGWDDQVRLPEAPDLDPDPAVVAVDLDVRPASLSIVPGTATPLYTYDGGVPGPLLRATVGDELRVHVTNHLPEPTTIHWHGVRVPNEMDGTPDVQPPIPPGGSFDAVFRVPDAGLYWYHPHFDSTLQVGWGLYGPLLVLDPSDPLAHLDSVVLVLSDLAIDEQGALLPPDGGGTTGAIFGHEGSVLLVNGKRRPTIEVRRGHTIRLRLAATAKSRYFELALDGHRFTEIGGDGGPFEAPVEVDTVVLAAGERRDVLLTPAGAPGETLAVRWIPFDRGYGSVEFRDPEDLFLLHVSDLPDEEPTLPPSVLATLPAIDSAVATPLSLALTLGKWVPPGETGEGETVMGIDGVPSWAADPIPVMLGETRLFEVQNDTDWAHPVHLHGFFFQALDSSGERESPARWRDTISVPAKDSRRWLVRFDERPGMWPFHCHILDHVDLGMMGMLHVMP